MIDDSWMMASATANSGSLAMSSCPYSPTQNDDAPEADSRAAKSWRNQRKSLGSRAKACSALKLSMTIMAGCVLGDQGLEAVDEGGQAPLVEQPAEVLVEHRPARPWSSSKNDRLRP